MLIKCTQLNYRMNERQLCNEVTHSNAPIAKYNSTAKIKMKCQANCRQKYIYECVCCWSTATKLSKTNTISAVKHIHAHCTDSQRSIPGLFNKCIYRHAVTKRLNGCMTICRWNYKLCFIKTDRHMMLGQLT